MDGLDKVARRYIANGWKVVSLDGDRLVMTKKKGPNGILVLLGVAGLLFYIVPGMFLLLLAYLIRGEETLMFTAAQAQELLELEQDASSRRDLEAAKHEADRLAYDAELLEQERRVRERKAQRMQKLGADLRRIWSSIASRIRSGS